jgi:hypothetical protein
MKKSSGLMTVRFDHLDPNTEKHNQGHPDTRDGVHERRRSSVAAGWDYSPLPRVTMRSFSMALLVSMGGLM